MKKTFYLSAIASAILASPVVAQDTVKESEIERITVTGDLRQSELADLSYTVSIVNAETIEDRAAHHIEDVLNTVPNVNFSSGASRARYFQIRGIGERSQFVDPINPSVGLIIDGIDYSGIGAAATLFDVQQVEVFRGPQGTRFGANALAGLINVRTTAAGNNDNLVTATLADYGTTQLGYAQGGDISADIGYRVSVLKQDSDGYIKNTFLNRDDTNGRDELSLKAKLAVALNDDSDLNWAFHYFDSDNGYDAFSLDNNRTTLSDEPGTDAQQTTAAAVSYENRSADWATLQMTASYSDTDIHYGYDEDWSFVGIRPDWEYSSTDNYLRDREHLSLDARLVSSEKILAGTTDWVAGIYWFDQEQQLTRKYTYAPADFTSDYETQNIAFYGELTTQLSDNFYITQGLRVEQFDADYMDSSAVVHSVDESLWGANVSLEYHSNDVTYYANIARGYKPGGVNGQALGEVQLLETSNIPGIAGAVAVFNEENLTSYELGMRGKGLDDALYFSAQLFYMDRHDVQIKQSFSCGPASEVPCTPPQFVDYIGNADVGSNSGLELELAYQLNEQLRLVGNYAVLNTDRSGLALLDINSDEPRDESRDQAHAPDYQYYLAAEYQLDANWSAKLEFEGKDGFFFSDSHDSKGQAINLVNAKVAYDVNDWSVSIWARNLTDEEYPIRGFFFGNDPRDEYAAKTYTQLGEPRLVGITANYRF
jgi:iron complex outermembrane receptor protein